MHHIWLAADLFENKLSQLGYYQLLFEQKTITPTVTETSTNNVQTAKVTTRMADSTLPGQTTENMDLGFSLATIV